MRFGRASLDTAPQWIGALAGAAAAGIFLAVGELLDGASTRVPSLVVAVGDFGIDSADARTTKTIIEWFDKHDKLVLIIGVVLATLLIGAIAGSLGRTHRWVPPTVFLAFGVAGGLAAGRDPQGSDGLGWLSAMVAALLGWLSYELLLRHVPRRAGETTGTPPLDAAPAEGGTTAAPGAVGRGEFVGWAAGVTVLAVLGALGGRWLRGRASVSEERAEIATRLRASTTTSSAASASAAQSQAPPASPPAPSGADPSRAADTSLPGLSSYITPNEDFYRIDTALVVPQVDPDSWRLQIGGMVDAPYELTLDEILAGDHGELVERTVTLSCVSNEIGGDLVGNAVWTGIPLLPVLERAGIQAGADQVVGVSVDGWTAGFPTGLLGDGRTALIAIAMNGEPLPVTHGFPARLIVAGLYGYVSAVKWLAGVGLTTWDGFDGYWIPRGWSKEGPMKITSRIDTPRNEARRAPGQVGIGGIAWAPTRGISAVEVQIDAGDWIQADLGEVVSDETWVQWTVRPELEAGRHTVRARAYDLSGAPQPPGPKAIDPDGAEGYHTITLNVEA